MRFNTNEAFLRGDSNLFFLPATGETAPAEFDTSSFVGTVVTDPEHLTNLRGKTVYLFERHYAQFEESIRELLKDALRVIVVVQDSDFSEREKTVDLPGNGRQISMGRIPQLIHDAGVLFPQFFRNDDIFEKITTEHVFQSLTESNKPGTAHRTGIYMTPVDEAENGDLHFRLLRCSSNLSGPTLNFQKTDVEIVQCLNQEAGQIFGDHSPLNHVLAQVYHNTPATNSKKQTKARIKAHTDKTKDMPAGGIMAFCTFYKDLDRLRPMGNFDYGAPTKGGKKISALTRLHFRLKQSIDPSLREQGLKEEFDLVLYPGSVFFMPLSTNRLYTHKINPPKLDVGRIPTRLGYVVRCSDTPAVYSGGKTCINRNKQKVPLGEPTTEAVAELKRLYALENRTDQAVEYPPFMFSLNKGDYMRPVTYKNREAFHSFKLDNNADVDISFQSLSGSVIMEKTGKGRMGGVLVKSAAKGTPIVRTTTAYQSPAQEFSETHNMLAEAIQKQMGHPKRFNNALIEVYDDEYTKMGFHSDQAIDLEDDSLIAIFTLYEDPSDAAFPYRKLVVEPKADDGGPPFEILLEHNSVVVFDTNTNKRHRHKIVRTGRQANSQNRWLGITFRTSKTFIEYAAASPPIIAEKNEILQVADATQRREFLQCRKRENLEVDFRYPVDMSFTLSQSDCRPPSTPGTKRHRED